MNMNKSSGEIMLRVGAKEGQGNVGHEADHDPNKISCGREKWVLDFA
jgi:hypothetical protein